MPIFLERRKLILILGCNVNFCAETTDEVLGKEKGWFPRHCVVRAEEEQSAAKKDD